MDELKLLLENPEPSLILLALCGLFGLIQLYYILFIHGKLAFHKIREIAGDQEENDFPPLSIVICTRNEESLLKANLPAFLEQDYPDFEVIVVNDRSEDDTKWVLQELALQYPNLKVSEIAEHVLSKVGKKFGVAMGIKAAKNEHLMFSDVSCIPNSKHWLKHMALGFSKGKEIVLGFAPMVREKGIKNAFIRFEHHYISINYLAYALARKAYMGLGQNMGYHKELFYRGKGFASHIHITSGYDALFVNQHANSRNVSIRVHPDAHVWKPAPSKGREEMVYKDQRLAIASFFRASHKRHLNLQALSAFMFYTSLVATVCFYPALWKWALGFYLCRLILQYAVYLPITKKLKINHILWYLPLLDLVQSFSRGWNVLFGKSKLYANG